MLNRGNAKSTLLVLSILLLSSLPLVPSASADIGAPEDLQAQDISASFDVVSETTTVTWRNIDQTGGDFDLYEDLWEAEYHVFRHTSPITPANIGSLSAWHTVVACDNSTLGLNPLTCRGQGGSNPHPGHSATFQVGAGTNGTYFYAITTKLGDGTFTQPLDLNASNLYEPVVEVTTPIRSPYNIQATFDPSTSKTTVQWINYNTINPVLPESGDDALQINLWRTDYQVQRSNGQQMVTGSMPIATLGPTTTQHVIDVGPNTNREVFYSVTYLLPNWTMPGMDYQDTRFLSNNAMNNAILEDNTPPVDVDQVSATFVPDENGTGITTISWQDTFAETGEQYLIYRHGDQYNNTDNPNIQLIATVQENEGSYEFNVPYSTFGDFYYCVVVVDQYGARNSIIPASSCDWEYEDSDADWVKEPTNVKATFLGNGITRVTWTDQMGVEGERYHIWRSSYRVTGAEFAENASLMWMGSVSDGVEVFDVQLEDDVSTLSSFYFVTSEAIYNCPGCNGTIMYTALDSNFDGPIAEDTRAPQPASILDAKMIGDLRVVDLEWRNAGEEVGETYSIYRHFSDPFGDSEFAMSNSTDDGWEFFEGPIAENEFSSVISQIPVPDDTQRDVWYAIVMADSYGNVNPQIFPGIGGNAVKVTEDTQAPDVTYEVRDEDGVPVETSSLVRGEYTLRIEVSEQLYAFPRILMTTSSGGDLINGEQTMVLIADNLNNPDKGPEFFQQFSISSTTKAGDVVISINLTDMSDNSINRTIDYFSIDAKSPVVTIYSPSSSSDGAVYQYGTDIKVVAGATDDVEIVSMQMRFVQNYGTQSSVTEPWRDVTGLTVDEDGAWSFEMEFSSGNFLYGVHEVSVKARDSAGNERTERVQFTTDWCRHRVDGETICEYSNPVPDDPETVYPELNATDPPYMIAWIASGISLLAVITSLVVIASSMAGPKKKKGDDEDEGDDWMNEFIGTSAEPDMATITGTAPAEEKKQEQTPEDDDDDDDDPFAVNVVQPKRRRKKKSKDEDDDDDDDDDDDKKKPKRKRAPRRRKPGRRKA